MTGWTGGLHIRAPDRTGTGARADYLCTHCGHHTRLTGRACTPEAVAALTDHRATCPAHTTSKEGTT